MPIVQSDISHLMNPAAKATFFQAYDEALQNQNWPSIATVIPSTTSTETYAWLGALASMSEWKDERILQALTEYSYTLTNKAYEASIPVDKFALDDDQFGQIQIRIRGLALEAARYKEYLVMSALDNGISATVPADGYAYDAAYFFGTSRTIGSSGAIDNSDSGALTATTLDSAIQKMMTWKDNQGKVMGIWPDTLVVGSTNVINARTILGSTYNADTTNAHQYAQFANNPFNGMFKLIVTPYISAGHWFLLDTSKAVKPIILQDRQPVQFEALEGNSQMGFMSHINAYGVSMRCAVGYGLPQTAYSSTG